MIIYLLPTEVTIIIQKNNNLTMTKTMKVKFKLVLNFVNLN